MRIDALTVSLRPRSSWEAVELGTALVRRHAAAIWRPWLALTLPVFVLVNALAGAAGLLPFASVAMWWLKPLFDRVPLFVLSRAVFGDVPSTRTTLRNAMRGNARAMAGYMTWRRFSPARSLLMPVDVLEGGPVSLASARRRVLAGPAYGVASLTLLAFANFEIALLLGLAALVFVFVPREYVQTSMQLLWQQLREAPPWLALLQNALAWIAASVMEPFYVGSGFGLYLNRRTEIEAWDIELAFRRLRARLLPATSALIVLLALALPHASRAAAPASSFARCPLPEAAARSVRELFGRDYRDARGFQHAVAQAYVDPRLSPRRRITTWKPRHPTPQTQRDMPGWLRAIARLFGAAGELLMWLLAAGLVLALVLTAKRWWPWLRSFASDAAPAPAAPTEQPVAFVEPLPHDIQGAARAHWAAGRAREALALVYRAAVEAMRVITDRPLPPGATEAQCLRAAAALPPAPRAAFARVVKLWQYAAYADRLPATDAFDAMLDDAALQFGWRG